MTWCYSKNDISNNCIKVICIYNSPILLHNFQLSGQLLAAYGYGAPEFESGIYTHQSDVYSFGVVMLELLTGRQSYDRWECITKVLVHPILDFRPINLWILNILYRTRTRGEQFLVRWAIPQLHDIDALSSMVDPSLSGEYPAKSLSNFADIISRCVQVRTHIYQGNFQALLIPLTDSSYQHIYLQVL